MQENHHEIETKIGTLRGMVHSPPSESNITVIIYHGYFSANRVGPARLYLELARYLCSKGFNVVRFDCFGVGDSEGSFSDVTFSTYKEDYILIYQYSRKLFPTNKFIIVGHSFGANVVCSVSKHFSIDDLYILLAPEVSFIGGIDTLFTFEQLKDLKDIGHTIRKGLLINNSFIEELRTNNILEGANKIKNKSVLIQGDKDELYSIEGVIKLANSMNDCIFIKIENADHNFLEPESRSKLYESIYEIISK
jgi:uncharacterized protein